ncbi:Uncharacterized protein FWK35_00026208 [Aphis craccivora]|uniref:Uncharacterized protein n=1 Tax=Aphis craccivora TaxID=307492 RepID=A0A6G0W2A4_APHCR|nr:Uncharacterized protein FWK35_00026208 [Aphis craccivora]
MDEFLGNLDDDECVEVLTTVENLGLCDPEDLYTTGENGKRVSSANTKSAIIAKKVRLNLVQSLGFVEISSSSNRIVTLYYVKNISNIENYVYFLDPIKSELVKLLKSIACKYPIKFNLKLDATYNIPTAIFTDTGVQEIVEEALTKLMTEQTEYLSKGNGFTLQCIDGLMLGVYKYTPMVGSSYMALPDPIENKKTTINPQNLDVQCLKWAILARHVTGKNKAYVGENYFEHEERYNFSDLSFPTPLHQVKIFERNNPHVSVNVYGIEKQFQPPKVVKYQVFPLKVVDEEKPEHFDLLLISYEDNNHFNSFARKRPDIKDKQFFVNVASRHLMADKAGLAQHKLVCGTHKPILPQMPEPGTMLEFTEWKKTQRHPIVIYANFEALLKKIDEKIGEKTTAFQNHEAMSYRFLVKANDNIPLELLEKYNITTSPIIYRENENNQDLAKYFVDSIVEIAEKIEKLLKTSTPIIFTDDQRKAHELCVTKQHLSTLTYLVTEFSKENHKVAAIYRENLGKHYAIHVTLSSKNLTLYWYFSIIYQIMMHFYCDTSWL